MAMIGLERQQIVSLLIEDLLRNFGLAAHGVERDEAVFQVQAFQQEWDGGDLVGLVLDAPLSQ